MKLWLVSFLILFFGAEGLQWFARLHWFSRVELSVPAVVIGGIGLALVSNYRQLQALGLLPQSLAKPDFAPHPEPTAAVMAPPPLTALEETQPAIPQAPPKEKSISFTVRTPKPLSFEIRRSSQNRG